MPPMIGSRQYIIIETNSLLISIRRSIEAAYQFLTGTNENSIGKMLKSEKIQISDRHIPLKQEEKKFLKIINDISGASKHNLLHELLDLTVSTTFERFFAVKEYSRSDFIKEFLTPPNAREYYTHGGSLSGKQLGIKEKFIVEYNVSIHQVMLSYLRYINRLFGHIENLRKLETAPDGPHNV